MNEAEKKPQGVTGPGATTATALCSLIAGLLVLCLALPLAAEQATDPGGDSAEQAAQQGPRKDPKRFSIVPAERMVAEALYRELSEHPDCSAELLSVNIVDVSCTDAQTASRLIKQYREDERVGSVDHVYLDSKEDKLDRPLWLTGKVLVHIDPDAQPGALNGLMNSLSARMGRRLSTNDEIHLVELPRNRAYDAADKIPQLESHPAVSRAVPEFFFRGLSYTAPNDALYSKQWSLRNLGTNIGYATQYQILGEIDADIDACEPSPPSAWDITVGASWVTVAVLDTGVDYSHEDLDGRLVTGADTTEEPYCATTSPVGSAPCTGQFAGHGTNCAGIIAATQNNYDGISGVAPGAKVMPIRISCGDEINITWALEAISIASSNAEIMSLSWGNGSGEWSQDIIDAINAAHDDGVVVVAATGNDQVSSMDDTAAARGSIAVSSSSPCDELIRFAPGTGPARSCDQDYLQKYGGNWGPQLDIVAPGTNMITTDNMGTCGSNTSYNGDYFEFLGTSASAPLVAGVAALILSIDPSLPPDGVRGFIASTAEQVKVWVYIDDEWKWWTPPDNVWYSQTGWGRINASAALQAVENRDSTNVHVNGGNIYDPLHPETYPNRVWETGVTQAQGFNTLSEGIDAVAEEGTLIIAAGTYDFTGTLDKPMRLTAASASVIIGSS